MTTGPTRRPLHSTHICHPLLSHPAFEFSPPRTSARDSIPAFKRQRFSAPARLPRAASPDAVPGAEIPHRNPLLSDASTSVSNSPAGGLDTIRNPKAETDLHCETGDRRPSSPAQLLSGPVQGPVLRAARPAAVTVPAPRPPSFIHASSRAIHIACAWTCCPVPPMSRRSTHLAQHAPATALRCCSLDVAFKLPISRLHLSWPKCPAMRVLELHCDSTADWTLPIAIFNPSDIHLHFKAFAGSRHCLQRPFCTGAATRSRCITIVPGHNDWQIYRPTSSLPNLTMELISCHTSGP